MNPSFFNGAAFAFILVGIFCFYMAYRNVKELEQDEPCEVPNDPQGDVNGRRLLNLDYRIEEIRHHVDHLATVQALILKDLKKEHHIEPAKDVLVTISDLPELKKSKERSA